MFADLFETAVGLVLSPLVFLLPGYAIGRLTGVLEFCSRSFVVRLAIALILSVAVGPVLIHLLLHFGWGAMWAVFGVSWIAAIGFFVRGRPDMRGLRRPVVIAFGVAIVLVFLIVDVGWGDRLYFSVVARDYLKHFALTEVIRAGGIPPTNPFFFDGEAVPLFYYYGWLLMTSALDAIGGSLVGPRGAVFAGTALIGVSLMATVAVFAHTLTNSLLSKDTANRGRWALPFVAVMLLLVGGLDIVMFFAGMAGQAALGIPVVFTDIEWWNEPLFLWITSVMTVPHHVAGLVAALVGLRIARWSFEPTGGRVSTGVVVAGMAFASSALCSIWVAMGAAVIGGAWVLLNVIRRNWREVMVWVTSGVVASLAALPYLVELSTSSTGDKSPLSFGIRYFGPFDRYLRFGRTGLEGLAHLVFLPIGYAVELGFVGVAGWLFWRARKRMAAKLSQDERLLRVMFVVGLVFPTFFYSAIRMNDLGFRVPMFAQFVLLLWAAFLIEGFNSGAIAAPTNWMRRALLVLAMVGVCSTFAQSLILRFVPIAADTGLIAMPGMYAQDVELGKRTAAEREAYEWLQQHTPEGAIVQHNPKPRVVRTAGGLAFSPALYARRPFAAYDSDMGTLFSVSELKYFEVADDIATAFDRPDAENAAVVAERHGLAALVVGDTDPIWGDRMGWAWLMTPDFANDYVRVYLYPAERF